jgi:hypothetical protein
MLNLTIMSAYILYDAHSYHYVHRIFITSILIINSTLSFTIKFILIIRPTRILHQRVGAYPHR